MKSLTNKKSAPTKSAVPTKKTAATKAPKTTPRAATPKTETAAPAPQTPDVAPVIAPAKQKASRGKKAPTSARANSKTTLVLGLLKRAGGVTAKELMATTGWQPHSIRGFISGTVGKKMGLKVVSSKNESGERTYTIAQ